MAQGLRCKLGSLTVFFRATIFSSFLAILSSSSSRPMLAHDAPEGLGAQGSSERQSASRTGCKHTGHLSPEGAGRAPPSAGGGVAGTKYRLQGLPGQRLPEPGRLCLKRKGPILEKGLFLLQLS